MTMMTLVGSVDDNTLTKFTISSVDDIYSVGMCVCFVYIWVYGLTN